MNPAKISVLLVAILVVSAEAKTNKAPSPPKEFAVVLSPGYGTIDHFSSDPKVFENLLINMKKSGFNTIHCVYRDWRIKLCAKHGVKMMVDILAWKDDVKMDIRRPKQRPDVEAICRKLRGNDAVWGYNLWNEKLSFFGYPDKKNIEQYIAMLKTWDPTHPVWVGTYRVSYANAFKEKPGIHAYYDYHWQRGFMWHFADLQWFMGHVKTMDGHIGRWILGSNYNWNSYTLNTSIPFGLKVCIWFIGGPFDKDGNIDPKHRFYHLVKICQERKALYTDLMKIGRPLAVYSTPTTKTESNKDKKTDVPWRLTPFPENHWLRVKQGQALLGFFKYPNGDDAVYIANHNAFAPQNMTLTLDPKTCTKAAVELLDRKTGKWRRLETKQGSISLELTPAGGELLRVTKRSK
jgi:hypothetical protein